MAEYIFSTPGGYRKFYVAAESEEQAIQRFKEASERGLTNGFQLEDLPNIQRKEQKQ